MAKEKLASEMTMREKIAESAMNGLLACDIIQRSVNANLSADESYKFIAAQAIVVADALIKKLEEKK